MAFLEELFCKKTTIPFNDEKHYDLFYFKHKNEFKKFKHSFENCIVRQKLSTWYGKLSDVVTVFPIPHFNKIRKTPISKLEFNNGDSRLQSCTSPDPDDHQIMFIAPAQLIPPNHIATVLEEYIYVLRDINKYIRNENGNKFRYNDEFTLYVAVRFSQIEEQKMRSLYIHELFSLVIRTIDEEIFNPPVDFKSSRNCPKYINLAMHRKDVYQTGLLRYLQSRKMSDSTNNCSNDIDDGDGSIYINLRVTLDDIASYLNELNKIDSLVIDTLIFADDNDVLKKVLGKNSDHKLDFTSDDFPRSISNDRSLDFSMLKTALRECNGICQTIINNKQESFDDAVARIIFLVNVVGISFDIPVKYIDQYSRIFKTSHHLFKQSCRTSKHMSIMQTFVRRVREVDCDKGYKIRTFNAKYWMIFCFATFVSIVYVVLRWNEPWEAKIQTVTALVTVIIAAVSTVILNTIYKGEAFVDVLSNSRFIDTQEEFEEKDWKQTSDIIEILRLSPKCPLFFGSGDRTSFLNRKPQNVGLQPKFVMSFSNLQASGYSLYECQKGYLYIFDPWDNLFRVYLVRNDEQFDSSFDESEHGLYLNRHTSDLRDRDGENSRKVPVWKVSRLTKDTHPLQGTVRVDIDVMPKCISKIFKQPDRKIQANITMFCKFVKLSKMEKFENNKELTVGSDRHSNREGKYLLKKVLCGNMSNVTAMEVESGSIEHEAEKLGWKLIHQSGDLEPLLLSRVLPYKRRKRAVGLVGLYTQLDTHWFDIDNKDLFRMDVGIYKGSDNDNNWRHRREDEDENEELNTQNSWLRLFRSNRTMDPVRGPSIA